MKAFEGKTAWVTGASSGIGEQLCLLLNGYKCKTIVSARNTEKLSNLKSQCAYPELVFIQEMDMETPEKIPEIVEEQMANHKKLDFIFNNAGISQRSFAMETELSTVRKIMEVNFFSNIALTRSLVPYMVKNKGGHITITSSVTGKYGYYSRSAYAASKHALHGYYESLRFELIEENIGVTFIIPGPVNSNMSANALRGDGTVHGIKDRVINKGVTPEKMADFILKATAKKKEEAFIGGKEVTSIHVKRLFPRLWTKIMLKFDYKKELK